MANPFPSADVGLTKVIPAVGSVNDAIAVFTGRELNEAIMAAVAECERNPDKATAARQAKRFFHLNDTGSPSLISESHATPQRAARAHAGSCEIHDERRRDLQDAV